MSENMRGKDGCQVEDSHIMPLYKEFTENTAGRDFVVGDLHGCRFLLEQSLARVKFDRTRDRVFSVGDLIDRGPESFRTLMLLTEPWFHAVVGNHEDMLLSYLGLRHSTVASPADFFENGGTWLLKLTARQKAFFEKTLVPLLVDLPYVIRVQGEEPFQVVHAELDAALQDREAFSPNLLRNDVWIRTRRGALTWARRLAKASLARAAEATPAPWHGINLGGQGFSDGSVTYAGHTVLPFPIRANGHLFLDGGACLQTLRNKDRPRFQGELFSQLLMFNHTEDCFV